VLTQPPEVIGIVVQNATCAPIHVVVVGNILHISDCGIQDAFVETAGVAKLSIELRQMTERIVVSLALMPVIRKSACNGLKVLQRSSYGTALFRCEAKHLRLRSRVTQKQATQKRGAYKPSPRLSQPKDPFLHKNLALLCLHRRARLKAGIQLGSGMSGN
jgi:hypothetical protein